MKGLFIAAAFAIAAVTAELGADDCTEGPSYWCSSSAAAKQCNTYQYCSSQVWQNGEAPVAGGSEPSTRKPPPGSDPCTRGPAFWCASLDNADFCGTGAYRFCSEHVWGQTPSTAPPAVDKRLSLSAQAEMLQLLDPEAMAKKVFSSLDGMDLKFPLDDCDCQTCYYIANLVTSWLRMNSTRNSIGGYYTKLCLNVPASMQEHCTDVVTKHFVAVIEDLSFMDPKKVCKDWCTNQSMTGNKPTLPKPAVSDKPVNTCLCQVCQQEFADLAQEFAKKRYQNELITEFTRFCKFLAEDEVARCTSIAQTYIPELYTMLSNLQPMKACSRFKFCENHTAPLIAPEKPTMPVTAVTTKHKYKVPCIGPYFDLTRRNADGSVPQEILEVAAITGVGTIPDDDCACEACKYNYGQLAACLKRNATQTWINTFYRKVCLDIPASMQEHCTDVVMTQFAELTEDLGKIDPNKACKKDCAGDSQRVAKVEDKSLSVTNTCLCQRCQSYIQELDGLLSQKSYQEMAAREYAQLCHLLKGEEAVQKCSTEAKQYIPELLAMLANLSPVKTCAHFKYCQKPLE